MRWPRVQPGEITFAVVGLPLAVACGLYVAGVLYIGGLLTLTIVGLPLVAAALRVTRGLGTAHRIVAERLLDEHVSGPAPLSPPRGPSAGYGPASPTPPPGAPSSTCSCGCRSRC